MKPRIYDREMNLIGVLQYATEVGYTHKYNDLHTAKFKLPANDRKNELCSTFNIVDIFDGEVSKGKYRILDSPDSDITSDGAYIEYSCEHVIAFLLNDIIDGYLELGGTDFSTAQVIETLLSKQTVKRWKLGRCDFTYYFQYSWENTNLLEALFSITTCFADKYRWTYDTSSYPWTINLIRQSDERDCEIRRRRNMNYIKRKIDSTQLCTRLYCKGNGEGVNQLTIAEVNDGKPYIDADPETIARYGILCSHYIDLTCTDAETLLAKGRQILNEVKNPIFTYTASAVDLSKVTGLAWDEFDEGKVVRMVDEEKSLDIDAMIIEVSKSDVDGDPLNVEITISNKSSDVSSDIEDLSRRAAITAQYSQGATNLYCEQFADNADESHPAKMNIYIPESCAKINQVLLSWTCASFRAYSKSAASGGGRTVTSAGGGQTKLIEAVKVLSCAGATGGTIQGESASPNGITGVPNVSDTGTLEEQTTSNSSKFSTDADGGYIQTAEAGSHTHDIDGHTHTMSSHTHSFSGSDTLSIGHTHSITNPGVDTSTQGMSRNYNPIASISGTTGGPDGNITSKVTLKTGESGAHRHNMGNHTHGMEHTHTLPAHSHNMNHTHDFQHWHHVTTTVEIPEISFDIPNHTHSVSLPDHEHGIVYGIYEGSTATSCVLKVDGQVAQTDVKNGNDIDIIPFLSKDGNGKINRGTWHTIEIVPDQMTRIEADLFVKTFITSYSGGNY